MLGGYAMMLQKTLIRSAARLIMICASVSICLFSLSSAGEEGIGVTRVGFVEGTASLKHKGTGYWVRLSEDQVVRAWDEIGTGGDGSVELLLPDESVVKVGPNTHVLVKEAGMVEVTKRATNIFELFVGEIRAVVAPLVNSESEFTIETENATVGVRGTDFGVSHDRTTKETDVLCNDGNVELRPKEVVMKGLGPIIVRGDEGIRLVAGRRPDRPAVWVRERRERFFRGLDFKGRRTRDIMERRFRRLESGGFRVIERVREGDDKAESVGDRIRFGTDRLINRFRSH